MNTLEHKKSPDEKKSLVSVFKNMKTLFRKRRLIVELTKLLNVFTARDTFFTGTQVIQRFGVQYEVFEKFLIEETTFYRWLPLKCLSQIDDVNRINRIHDLIEDCINTENEEYIDMRRNEVMAKQLFVSSKGRELLTTLGFFEILQTKYSRTQQFILGFLSLPAVYAFLRILYYLIIKK